MVLKSLGVAVVVFMTISYNAQKEMIVMIMALQKQVWTFILTHLSGIYSGTFFLANLCESSKEKKISFIVDKI